MSVPTGPMTAMSVQTGNAHCLYTSMRITTPKTRSSTKTCAKSTIIIDSDAFALRERHVRGEHLLNVCQFVCRGVVCLSDVWGLPCCAVSTALPPTKLRCRLYTPRPLAGHSQATPRPYVIAARAAGSMNYAQKPGFHGQSVARNPEDEKKQVWTKLQALRNSYLEDMIELYGMLTARSNQPMPAEQLQKLKHYKDVLHRMIPYLRVPQDRVPKEFNIDKVDAFEKQIVNIMETFKRRRQGAA